MTNNTYTIKEISIKLNISEKEIRRIEKQALNKIFKKILTKEQLNELRSYLT